jgi:hypothetical protein
MGASAAPVLRRRITKGSGVETAAKRARESASQAKVVR